MDRHHNNYEAFKAMHEARMQQVRASAVAGRRSRRDVDAGMLRRIAQWLAPRPRTGTPDAAPAHTNG